MTSWLWFIVVLSCCRTDVLLSQRLDGYGEPFADDAPTLLERGDERG
jgi:hypothetical protein